MRRRIINKQFKYDVDDVRVGISLSFGSKGIFTSTTTTAAQLRYNLIDLLMTNKGERFFDPDYGCDLSRRLFEPITLSSAVEESIVPTIAKYIPQITVDNVDVSTGYSDYTLFIKIEYSINHTQISDTVQIAL